MNFLYSSSEESISFFPFHYLFIIFHNYNVDYILLTALSSFSVSHVLQNIEDSIEKYNHILSEIFYKLLPFIDSFTVLCQSQNQNILPLSMTNFSLQEWTGIWDLHFVSRESVAWYLYWNAIASAYLHLNISNLLRIYRDTC